MDDFVPKSADEIWHVVAQERARLCDLLAALPESDWAQPSLCGEWRVRDVAAHLVVSTRSTVGFLLVNLLRSRGSIPRLIRDTAIRHSAATSTERLLAELRESVDSRFTAVGTTPADRLLDVLVHAQDIAVPLAIAHPVPPGAARLALDRIWATRGFDVPPLSRFRLVATDADWAKGNGPTIAGPIAALLMLATGRTAFRDALAGDGTGHLPR